jgi:RNA polymerase sigma-70 factor (ECF subfamily)
MASDEQLLELLLRAGRGREEAFAELYRLTAPRLFGVCLKMLHRRDLAEDVLQEAFVKIWHHAGDYDVSRGNVMTWMSSIVRYKAIDRLRQLGGRRESELDDAQWAGFADEGPGPMQTTLHDGNAAALELCLDTLAGNQRESIRLAFFHGFTHDELCQRLGKPLGTVKSWVRRGLQGLKRCLEQ